MSSLGAKIDALQKKRVLRAAAQKKADDIDAEVKAMEAELLEALSAEGIDKASGKLATVSVSNTVVASVKDWDSFYEYIRKYKFFHLLQRRVADLAYRELIDQGKKVPGTEPFTKTSLRVTASK